MAGWSADLLLAVGEILETAVGGLLGYAGTLGR